VALLLFPPYKFMLLHIMLLIPTVENEKARVLCGLKWHNINVKIIKIYQVGSHYETCDWTMMTESEILMAVIMRTIFLNVIPCHCHENLKSNTVTLYMSTLPLHYTSYPKRQYS
jgi:hypothetical protein